MAHMAGEALAEQRTANGVDVQRGQGRREHRQRGRAAMGVGRGRIAEVGDEARRPGDEGDRYTKRLRETPHMHNTAGRYAKVV